MSLIQSTYLPEDVTVLLQHIDMAPTDIRQKERLIQSGQAHYSEMISEERRPDERYMTIFREAGKRGDARIAAEIAALARTMAARIAAGTLEARITLCSLVRAGLPYGVLLRRELAALGVDVVHFGVSIIRDRGLDATAMDHVLSLRPLGGIVFVDGWTGKGAISTELTRSWQELTGRETAELAVLADPSGFATLSGSHEDWLIPSGILGANVSGLISRSILKASGTALGEFHGAVPVTHLSDIDVSRAFVDRITALAAPLRATAKARQTPESVRAAMRRDALDVVQGIADREGVDSLNRIKPGIAEATRAVLRRRPHKVFLRALDDPDLAALRHLCESDTVEIVEAGPMIEPYRAVTVIEKVA